MCEMFFFLIQYKWHTHASSEYDGENKYIYIYSIALTKINILNEEKSYQWH